MYDFLKGKLILLNPPKAVLDVRDIGYEVHLPLRAFASLSLQEELILYTHLVVREDAHTLYGFLTREERELFQRLIMISGIGPKTALSLLGHLQPEELFSAILEKNTPLLSKVPGIGKKTAERLLMELKDLGKDIHLPPSETSDAYRALLHLGYHPFKARKAIDDLLKEKPSLSTADIVKEALKKL